MKKQSILLILALSASTIGLSGCSNNAQTGAVIGSLVGAGIGKSTSNHRDKRAAIGAVLGGLVGASIGQEQDARNAAARGYSTSTATTTPYTNGSATHSHGNRTHTHPGAADNHSHNNGASSAQLPQREVVYVERPYYPVSTSIVLGTGYYHYPRRHYRHNKRYRHNNRHYRHNNRHYRHNNRHYRHNNRHYNKGRY